MAQNINKSSDFSLKSFFKTFVGIVITTLSINSIAYFSGLFSDLKSINSIKSDIVELKGYDIKLTLRVLAVENDDFFNSITMYLKNRGKISPNDYINLTIMYRNYNKKLHSIISGNFQKIEYKDRMINK